MKEIFLALSLVTAVPAVFAQGTVIFANTQTTLVSSGPAGLALPISGPPGSYYFGLLIAPVGTLAASQFAFTGVYATNSAVAGRILPSGYSPAVPGWPIAAAPATRPSHSRTDSRESR